MARVIAIACLGLFGVIPIRMAIAHQQAPTPQAILVLGGDTRRMRQAAKLMQSQPELEVWVSDLRWTFERNRRVFRQAGIAAQRLHFDFCPVDTVTNFTCLVADEEFTAEAIQHLYLVTSDYHMARARAIATIVLGSRGIVVTPVPVPSRGREPETWWRIGRDSLRSLAWIVTGRTGAKLGPQLSTKSRLFGSS